MGGTEIYMSIYQNKPPGYDLAHVPHIGNLSTKQLYLQLRGQFQKVSWRKLVCNNRGLPRWTFILRLAALGRLSTRDRLYKWGIQTTGICPLCEVENESIPHLFFACTISAQVWRNLLLWIDVNRAPMMWDDELLWAEQHAKGRSPKAEMYRMVLAAAVYFVWKERNFRIFQNKRQSTTSMIKQVIQEVHIKATKDAKLITWLENHNFYPVC
ncbi:uncharacterized protein LOC132053957 [Lycium ferocissimum]|uniref:uncharacterized protein LOC132053957 n=1 Tax=Lycium ferocissimum TaxID=112874 RepID=UPI002814F9D9|nr:uncharacterized protein LOC132053957 [Lycium ferocissimum]